MSAFLGPIHHWLFNKIKYLENIELQIIESKIPLDYMLMNKNLEDVIDENQIHKSLQDMISTTEIRFSKTINEVLNKKNIKFIEEIFKKQGQKDGLIAKKNLPITTLESIYKKLNDFILDGMPCDTTNNIDLNEDNSFKWHTNDTLHKPFWDINDIDIYIFYQLKKLYVNTFIQTFDSKLHYNYTNINGMISHEIVRR